MISLYSFPRGVEWDTGGLLHFLSSIPSIQFLTLEFKCAQLWSGPDIFTLPSSEVVELSHVEHLSFVIRQRTHTALLEELMGNLELPNIKRVSIEAHFAYGDLPDHWQWFRALLAQDMRSLRLGEEDVWGIFHSLEKLDLRIFDETFSDEDIFPWDTYFPSMPSLRHLSIRAPGLACPTNWDLDASGSRLKELRALRLKNCHYFEHKHVGDDPLVDAMEALVLGALKRLERVEFNNCPDMHMMKWKGGIEEVFPKEKLHWSTSTG